jgi:hypothetical protein
MTKTMFRQEQLSTRAQTFRATRCAICDLDAFLSDTYGTADGIAAADVMTEHSLSPLLAIVEDIADVDEVVQVVPRHEYIVQGLHTTVGDTSYTIVHCMHSRQRYDAVECWLRRDSGYRIQSIQHLQPIQYASGRFDRLVQNSDHCNKLIAEVFDGG